MISPSGVSMGPGGLREIAAQELLERALADEADAGAVRLVEHRQARPHARAAHLGLAQLADAETGCSRSAGRRDAVQEIALILGRVGAP